MQGGVIASRSGDKQACDMMGQTEGKPFILHGHSNCLLYLVYIC